jgi:protease-4
MSLETDLLLDRRRLKRRLLAWRLIGLAAVVIALFAVFAPFGAGVTGGRHVVRLNVRGIITDDRKTVAAIDALATDDNVAALIVAIDSPGGSVAGGESLHDAIARVAAAKPVVAVMGATAASAGYMIAVPAARIWARDATLTGSIGVILETGEASGLLRSLGVNAEAITSGPLKDQPSFIRPLTDQGRTYLHDLVMDMYDQFVSMVAAGRHMDKAKVVSLADGRAYTGRQALGLGLIDAIGGERDARTWLAAHGNVPVSLPVDDLRTDGLLPRMISGSLDGLLGILWKTLGYEGVRIDGAYALWQAGMTGR